MIKYKQKPNILHLFTDMQRFDTIAALGNPVIKTPNLDRLCHEGVAFTSAYSPSPVCIAARSSMITGQYPMHTGCYENMEMPDDGRSTFMEELTTIGYRTHGIGKCHFFPGKFDMKGFQSREVQEEGGENLENLVKHHYMKYLRDKGYDHICEAFGSRGELYYIPQPSQLPVKDHPTQWIGDRSIEFIQKDHKKPWYLFSSFIHPHPPFTPPTPWHKLYRPSMMPLPDIPEDYKELMTFANHIQNRYKYGDRGLNLHTLRAIKAYYYACISFVDYQIGRILHVLKETGQLDDTLILFSSDHGAYLGDYRCFGKRSMHDASSRIPMILRLPGRFEGGCHCDTPVSLVDIAPTFLSAAEHDDYLSTGSVRSHGLDGIDLKDILSGKSSRDKVFSQLSYRNEMAPIGIHPSHKQYLTNQSDEASRAQFSTYMAVSKEWKYFYSAPDNKEFLFHRLSDSKERNNKAGVSCAQTAKNEMKQSLFKYLQSGDETGGIEGDNWKLFPAVSINPDPDSGLLIFDGYTPWVDMSLPKGY